MTTQLKTVLKKYLEIKESLTDSSKDGIISLCNEIQKLSLLCHSIFEEELLENLGFEVQEAYLSYLETLQKLQNRNIKWTLEKNELRIIKPEGSSLVELWSPREIAGFLNPGSLSEAQLSLLELYCSEREVFLGINLVIHSS